MLERPLPSLSSIRAFEAAARLGSFAKAAAELGTSAASVSYHVAQLERQVGVPLFRRHAQSVTLTEQGAAIAPEVTAAFASLRTTFASAADACERRLALTTLPTFGTSWLTPKLGRFCGAQRAVTVELDLSDQAQELGGGRFDAAIRNGHGKWPGLRAVKLLPSVFMPLCAPGLIEAARRIADPRRRIDAPLLGRPDWWALWYQAIGERNVDLAERFGATLPAEHLDAAAAMAGQGVTIGSPILFADDIEAGRLTPAHDLVASDGRAFWFAFPAARASSRKISAFRDWICAEAERVAVPAC
ncbi:MAG: LysR substrate-binding domain-containing protein [Vitreimonas sp.]